MKEHKNAPFHKLPERDKSLSPLEMMAKLNEACKPSIKPKVNYRKGFVKADD